MNKKHKKRVVFILTMVCMTVTILSAAYKYLYTLYLSYKFHMDLSNAASIGIIGGADGPTTIVVSDSRTEHLVTLIFALLSIAGIVYLIALMKKDKGQRE